MIEKDAWTPRKLLTTLLFLSEKKTSIKLFVKEREGASVS